MSSFEGLMKLLNFCPKDVYFSPSHASTIRIGRNLWQSAPLDESTESLIEERVFEHGSFPPLGESKKAVARLKKADEERPQPFAGRTLPYANLTVRDYGKRIDAWLNGVKREAEPPNEKQMQILKCVIDRILVEFRLHKEGSELRKGDPELEREEEPLRGLVHGPPGTGKSRVINWIRRLFVEALGWQHGVEFIFVAFQNRVAYAMGGTTLHDRFHKYSICKYSIHNVLMRHQGNFR